MKFLTKITNNPVTCLFLCFLAFFANNKFVFAQNNNTQLFEKGKLQVICQAVKFNCLQQGKMDIIEKISCETLGSLEKSIPASFKGSKKLVADYKKKTYPNLKTTDAKLERINKDILDELKKLGTRINKEADKLVAWEKGVDSLALVFGKIREEIVAETSESNNNQEENITTKPPTENAEDVTATIVTPQTNENSTKGAESNTGLWIITIVSALAAFVSLGMAYMVQKTSEHKIRELEMLVKERYQHLDTRLDKMATKEELAISQKNTEKIITQSNLQSNIQSNINSNIKPNITTQNDNQIYNNTDINE